VRSGDETGAGEAGREGSEACAARLNSCPRPAINRRRLANKRHACVACLVGWFGALLHQGTSSSIGHRDISSGVEANICAKRRGTPVSV
jgi:hypothetical protein